MTTDINIPICEEIM